MPHNKARHGRWIGGTACQGSRQTGIRGSRRSAARRSRAGGWDWQPHSCRRDNPCTTSPVPTSCRAGSESPVLVALVAIVRATVGWLQRGIHRVAASFIAQVTKPAAASSMLVDLPEAALSSGACLWCMARDMFGTPGAPGIPNAAEAWHRAHSTGWLLIRSVPSSSSCNARMLFASCRSGSHPRHRRGDSSCS